VDDMAAAVAATTHAVTHLPNLEAAEFVDAACLALVAEGGGLAWPFDASGPGVLPEVAGEQPVMDELSSALSTMPGLRDALLADDGPGRRRLWAFRDGVTEAISAVGVPHKLDVGLPRDRLAAFAEALGPTVEAAHGGARRFVFGHIGLGNLHVNVVGPAPGDERVDDAVLRLVADLGGQVAAEHGIGRAKARWLTLARSPEELAAHAALKRALDPLGVLNPGVLDSKWVPEG
jgi:FAD/FMN-containing dehydrogenase